MQMINALEPELSIMSQCQLLNISRSSFYYKAKPIAAEDLELMRLINEQYLKTPSWGSHSMRNHLRRQSYKINRKKVQRLMRLIGLEAIYPKPRTGWPHPEHKVFPYLLRDPEINRHNQV
jgi:putative transposase